PAILRIAELLKSIGIAGFEIVVVNLVDAHGEEEPLARISKAIIGGEQKTVDAQGDPFKLVTCDAITSSVPEWLSPNVLPRGVCTLLTGKAGSGKTSLVRAMVGHLASGQGVLACPSGPIEILWLCYEDSPAALLLPALIAEGLTTEERARVHLLDGDDPMAPTVKGFQRLSDTLGANPKIQLLIVDTLALWVTGAGADLNDQKEVRATLGPLQALCERRGITAVVIHHEVKNAEVQGSLRAAGSAQIGAAVRLHWGVVPDAGGAKLVHLKSNIGLDSPKCVRFRKASLSKEEALEACRQVGADTSALESKDGGFFAAYCRQEIAFDLAPMAGDDWLDATFRAEPSIALNKRKARLLAAEKTILHKMQVMGSPGIWHRWSDVRAGLIHNETSSVLENAMQGLVSAKALEKLGPGAGKGIQIRLPATVLLGAIELRIEVPHRGKQKKNSAAKTGSPYREKQKEKNSLGNLG
ncbi:MAG: AAA family ATPase, partial [Planctomycetota bacterium]|nr:AAA family ATPase [Planctomycetota bacterium]